MIRYFLIYRTHVCAWTNFKCPGRKGRHIAVTSPANTTIDGQNHFTQSDKQKIMNNVILGKYLIIIKIYTASIHFTQEKNHKTCDPSDPNAQPHCSLTCSGNWCPEVCSSSTHCQQLSAVSIFFDTFSVPCDVLLVWLLMVLTCELLMTQ